MSNPDSNLEPWQWPEEHGASWSTASAPDGGCGRPNGRAVPAARSLWSFDSDHETSDLRDGGKSIGRLAWGQYGNRVGVPRILNVLEKHGVKGSFTCQR